MLYLIKSYSAIKIGSTNNIKMRMREYKTHNPDFELIDIADGMESEEKILHSKLKDFKYKNSKEWFIDCEKVREEWNNYVKTTRKNILNMILKNVNLIMFIQMIIPYINLELIYYIMNRYIIL